MEIASNHHMSLINTGLIIKHLKTPLVCMHVLQIEPGQGSDDDSSVNAVRLLCIQTWDDVEVGYVESLTLSFGSYRSPIYCPTDYWLVAFKVRVLHFGTCYINGGPVY